MCRPKRTPRAVQELGLKPLLDLDSVSVKHRVPRWRSRSCAPRLPPPGMATFAEAACDSA